MYWPKAVAGVCCVAVLTWAQLALSAGCPGDCDGNGIVRVDELIRGVDIALGTLPLSACPAFDCQDTGSVPVECVVAAVGASLDGCSQTPTPSPTATSTSPTPTATATAATPSPTPTPITLPLEPVQLILQDLPSALLSISGTSAADVYTVGADAQDGMGPTVLNYDGHNWHRLSTGTMGNLWWISVTPIDDAFYMAGENGVVVRYQLMTQKFTPLPVVPDQPLLFGVWGTDTNTIWVVGTKLSNQGPVGGVWRYDGTRWTADSSIGQLAPQGLPILYKVWGRNDHDLYVVGASGVVFHYDGTIWTKAVVDLGSVDPSDAPLFTVNGNATDVTAVGGLVNGLILEPQAGTFENQASAVTPQMNGVFIRPDGAGMAVGIAGNLAFRNAGVWQLMTPAVDTNGLDFHGSWIDPAGGVWAVGGNLTTDLSHGILAYGGMDTISSNIEPGN